MNETDDGPEQSENGRAACLIPLEKEKSRIITVGLTGGYDLAYMGQATQTSERSEKPHMCRFYRGLLEQILPVGPFFLLAG